MHLINQLARKMYLRKERGERPYIFFLGAGVSISSGISSMTEMIDRFLIDIGTASSELEKMDGEQRFERFFFAMGSLSEVDRFAWLNDGFKGATPSLGYQALAKLVEDGYVDTIFTTNWDELLEDSLKISKKLKYKKDYGVYVRGVVHDEFIVNQFLMQAFPKTKIVKLHGELESRIIFVTPQETTNFSAAFTNFFREEIFRTRDIIMIGYSVADQNLKNFFTSSRSSFYYVNPKPPDDSLLSRLNHLEYFASDFDTFMVSLAEAITREEIGTRSGVPDKLMEKFSEDLQKLREDFEILVSYLKNQPKN